MEKHRVTLVAAFMLSAALLAGCGNDGEPNDVESSYDEDVTNEREPGTSDPSSDLRDGEENVAEDEGEGAQGVENGTRTGREDMTELGDGEADKNNP